MSQPPLPGLLANLDSSFLENGKVAHKGMASIVGGEFEGLKFQVDSLPEGAFRVKTAPRQGCLDDEQLNQCSSP